MSSIPRVSLEDTLYLVQMLRETAMSKGRFEQAEKLTPVMRDMRELVNTARKSAPAASAAQPVVSSQAPAAPSGLLAQSDFQKLLEVTRARESMPQAAPQTDPLAAAQERNRLISAMSAAHMSDLDIARQMGMTREEVRLVLSVQGRLNAQGGINR